MMVFGEMIVAGIVLPLDEGKLFVATTILKMLANTLLVLFASFFASDFPHMSLWLYIHTLRE